MVASVADMFGKPDGSKLPAPTVKAWLSNQETTPERMKGILCNPIYAGLGPFPRLVSDEEWVSAAAGQIREDGAEQFLVNMLLVLRASVNERVR